MIDVGMLWLDADRKRPLQEKVARAVDYYESKYGRLPDLCLVHPEMLSEEEMVVGETKVHCMETVLPHHFWLGVKAA